MSDEKQRQRKPQDQGNPTAAPPPHIALMRCPHCQSVIDPAELAGVPLKICPRCHLPIEKVNLA